MFKLIRELRQRSVFRGAGFYLLAAWGMLQVGDVIVEPAGLPPWSMTALLYLLVLGFPIAMVFSWRYDLTDHGIVRAGTDPDDDSGPQGLGAADYILLVSLFAIGGFALYQLLPIAQQSEAPATASATTDLQNLNPNSIAVLPFADISQNRDQEFLGDGISDTVMHVLSQIAGLSVTARTSSFAFKGKNLDVAEIARALAVAHVLEGSVQKAAEKVRIIARLIDARRGTEIWSGYYDREIDSIFAIQDEIAREVATALTTEVLNNSGPDIDEGYRPSLEAYEKFILGKQEFSKRSSTGAVAALPLFEEAVALDPNYALAHVYLAQAVVAAGGQNKRGESLSRASVSIAKALDLDPQLADAHAANAFVLMRQKKFPEAEEAVNRALELRPSFASAYATQSLLRYMQGDLDKALELVRKAIELDPQENRYRTQLAQALWSVSRSEEAVAITKDAIRRNPDVPMNYAQLGRWSEQMGDLGKGAYWERYATRIDPAAKVEGLQECLTLTKLWAWDKAVPCLESHVAEQPEDTEGKQYLAVLTNDEDLGLSNLRDAIARNPNFAYRRYQISDWLVQAGLWQETIDTLKPVTKPLFEEVPRVDDFSVWAVRNLAQAYRGLGNDERADLLLDAGLAHIDRRRKLQGAGFVSGIEDVQFLMLKGRIDEAMSRLLAAVKSGWRFYSFGLKTPFFDPVRDHPAFQKAYSILEEDMKDQLAWYEEHRNDPIESMGI
jgi:TolB-like protein/lipopolysaccharide biosynthesis regulator YciM